MTEDTRRILDGKPLDGKSENRVDDVPDSFKDWVKDNAGRITRAKSLPYFLRDNGEMKDGKYELKKFGAAGTAPAPRKSPLEIAKERHAARTPKQIQTIKDAWEARQLQNSQLKDTLNALSNAGIEYNDVKALQKPLSTDEIINRIGGGDLTKGSCASVAMAFVGNHGGLDVLDFRGGKSLDFFARRLNLWRISEKVGGYTDLYITGVQLMKQMKEGRLYYLVHGRHAAIARQISNGKYEYLELQSPDSNGWKPLNGKVFPRRFGSSGRDVGMLIDIESLQKDSGFRKMLGYINTEAGKQRKGAGGTIK